MLARAPQLLLSACLLGLTGALPGCAVYAKCGLHGCAGDAEITANVQAHFDRYPSLQAPNQLRVQTVNHVVYLTGLVNTPFEYRFAEEVAREAADGSPVVNMVGVANER